MMSHNEGQSLMLDVTEWRDGSQCRGGPVRRLHHTRWTLGVVGDHNTSSLPRSRHRVLDSSHRDRHHLFHPTECLRGGVFCLGSHLQNEIEGNEAELGISLIIGRPMFVIETWCGFEGNYAFGSGLSKASECNLAHTRMSVRISWRPPRSGPSKRRSCQ